MDHRHIRVLIVLYGILAYSVLMYDTMHNVLWYNIIL